MTLAFSGIPSCEAQQARPVLKPGQKILGAEHPEVFSRRIAFEMCLNLLAVDAEDAIHLQRRARFLEKDRIGLDARNSAPLEQIVEGYRVKRNAINQKAHFLHSQGSIAATGWLKEVNHERFDLLRATQAKLNASLEPSAKKQLNLFLDQIIAKSEIHASGTEAAK